MGFSVACLINALLDLLLILDGFGLHILICMLFLSFVSVYSVDVYIKS